MLQNKKYGPDWELIGARKIYCNLYRLKMTGRGGSMQKSRDKKCWWYTHATVFLWNASFRKRRWS